MIFSGFWTLAVFGYLASLTLAARIRPFSALSFEATGRNASGRSNSTRLNITSNILKSECGIDGGDLRLVYIAQGTGIKSKRFDALLAYAFGIYVEAAELYGWDSEVGTQPLQLVRQEYWLVFDDFNVFKQPTWRNMIEMLGLIEHCYSIGNVEEFVAEITKDDRRLANGKLFFKKDPRVVVAQS